MPLSVIRSLTVTQQLGYAGLLPFFATLLLYAIGVEQGLDLFVIYSVLILAFMAGACWGVGQVRPERRRTVELVISIGVSLWALLMQFLPGMYALIGLLSGYWVLIWLEREPTFRYVYRADYRYLRKVLTTVVSLCHLVMLWLLLG